MTRSRILIAIAVVVVLAGIGLVAIALNRDNWEEPKPDSASAPSGLAQFYDQKVSWSSCDSARCAWIKVPVDYTKPDGATTRLRAVVHPAEGGKAKRSIFVNPGGPGGSAVDFASFIADEFGDDVREMYDIVGVDPRGVAESTPLTCLSDKKFDAFTATDPDPDEPSEITALRQSVTDLGEACEQNSGELAAHVSTVEAAKDMDVVRALLGRSKMDWFGASYGTQLGAVYAELFPEKVGRMVLDGAVDPSLDAVGSSLAQTTGFQRALEAYAKDCVNQSRCPLGNDAEAGLAKIADLMDRLDAEPMRAQAGRPLTEGQAFYGVAVTLYDKSTWPALTQGLNAAFQGDGSVLLRLSDAYFDRKQDGSYGGNTGQVIYAVNCLDAPDRLTLEETEAILPRFQKVSPVFGRALGWGALGCADWPVEVTNPLPKIEAKGAPPIVVLGTTRDPATPYESAQALASQLESGVLVTREGDGHTAYTSGNQCITEAVDAFFTKGTVPEKGLTCEDE
ncbi:alpha/beta hydrolase [Aeromicrobium sp. NPDC092404]|uniref:alpha/beta hydrolase n=1 Tax=Aeromicrobium sp. NPDC092404 TaxID=3154976 RepID=UPI00343A1841